jgi:hypothetical protein
MRRKSGKSNGDAFGLLACGSAGAWDISIDETVTGPDRWFANIQGPSVNLQFEIASPSMIARALRFLDKTAGRSLRVGTADRWPVTLVWDDEFADRCFLIVGSTDRPAVRLTLNGQELAKIKIALRQAGEDLKPEKHV